jgi:hypothetical protein
MSGKLYGSDNRRGVREGEDDATEVVKLNADIQHLHKELADANDAWNDAWVVRGQHLDAVIDDQRRLTIDLAASESRLSVAEARVSDLISIVKHITRA